MALGLIYTLILGPSIAVRAKTPQSILDSPRSAALLALLLLFGVPALIAILGHAIYLKSIGVVDRFRDLRWQHLQIYDNTPTAWDVAFRGREEQFVRVLTADNKWVGGLADENAFATAYPENRELYLSVAYKMFDDGTFSDEVINSTGMWVRCDDVQLVQFVAGESVGDDRLASVEDTERQSEGGRSWLMKSLGAGKRAGWRPVVAAIRSSLVVCLLVAIVRLLRRQDRRVWVTQTDEARKMGGPTHE